MGNTTQAGHIQNNKITFLRDKYMKSFGNVKIYEVKHFNKQVVGIPCLLPVSDPQKRIDLKHPNLLNALAFEHQFMEVFGLSSNNLIYFFEHVETQLAQVLHQRISLNSRFPEGDIIRIATEVLNCLVYLQKFDITMGNIEPCTIFHDTNENCIKMYDTTLILGEYPIYKMAKSQFQGRKPYYTPEVIYALTFHQEEVLSKYKFQSDIFQLGLTLLELCSFQDSTQLFDTDKKKINTQEMDLRLTNISPTYSHKLQQVIKSMLNLDPRKRPSAQELLIQMHSSTIQPAVTPTPFQSCLQNSQIQISTKRAQTPNSSTHCLYQQVQNSPNVSQHGNNYHARSVSPVSPIIKQRSARFEQVTQRNLSQIVSPKQQENVIQNYSSNIPYTNNSHNNSFITYTNSNNQSFYNSNNNNNNNSCNVSFQQVQQIPQNQKQSQTQINNNQIIQQQIPTQKVRFDERSISPSQQLQSYYKPNYRNINSFTTQSKSQNVSPVRSASNNSSFIIHNNQVPNTKPNLSFASLLQNKQEQFNTNKITNLKNKEQLFESKESDGREIHSQQSRITLADKTNQYNQRNNVVSKATPFLKQNSNNNISIANNETSISNNSSFVQHVQNPSYYFFQNSSNQPNNENIYELNNKSRKESNYFSQNNNISNNQSSNSISFINQNDSQFLNENSFLVHQKQYQLQQNNNQYKQTIIPSPILSKIIKPVNQRVANPIPKITVITSTHQRSLSPIVGRITKPPMLLSPQIQITPVIPSVMTNYNSPIHQLNKIQIQPHIQSPQANDLINPQPLTQYNSHNPVSQFESESLNQEKIIKLIDMQQPVIIEESDKQSIASFSHPQQFIQKPINQVQQEYDKNEQYIERYTFNELGSTPSNSDQQQNYYQNANSEEFVQTGGDLQNNKYKKQTEMNLFRFFDQPDKIDPELTAMASPTTSIIPQFPQYNISQLNPQFQNRPFEQPSENQYSNQDQQQFKNLSDHSNHDNQEENKFQFSDLQNQKYDQTVQRIQNKLNQMGNLEERLQNLIQKNYQLQQND
ncbi:hypothetical protein ABPG74_006553 [Tetrahymena malaccensis]